MTFPPSTGIFSLNFKALPCGPTLSGGGFIHHKGNICAGPIGVTPNAGWVTLNAP
jgi:hypothetical protein